MIALDWMDDGACHNHPTPQIFFPEAGQHDKRNAALRVCRGCPIQRRCLEHALRHHEVGIWGATTEEERRQMRRSRRVA